MFPFCCSYSKKEKKKEDILGVLHMKDWRGGAESWWWQWRRWRRWWRRGLQSSHQQAAMTSCHSCQGLWEIFCQGKANSSSFTPNRTVRPSEQGGNVVSLELRALFKTAALRLPHGTCNKGPSVRHTGQHRELMTGFTVMHRLGLYWSWK